MRKRSKNTEVGAVFIHNMNAEMESRGLSAAELSRRTGLAEAAICYIKRSKREPLLSTAINIADALGVPLSKLVK